MKLLFVSLFALQSSQFVAAEGEGHACACEAEEFGFDIDCANQDVTLQALADLSANGCDQDCSISACEKPFLIVQSHHDFCLHDELPNSVETVFHFFEEACEERHCDINRKFDPSLQACPQVDCSTEAGNVAFRDLQADASCFTNCGQTSCAENYRILRAFHDTCDHDVLETAAETVIHDLEEPCEAQNCNVLSDETQNVRILQCAEVASSPTSNSADTGIVAAAIGIAGAVAFL